MGFLKRSLNGRRFWWRRTEWCHVALLLWVPVRRTTLILFLMPRIKAIAFRSVWHKHYQQSLPGGNISLGKFKMSPRAKLIGGNQFRITSHDISKVGILLRGRFIFWWHQSFCWMSSTANPEGSTQMRAQPLDYRQSLAFVDSSEESRIYVLNFLLAVWG